MSLHYLAKLKIQNSAIFDYGFCKTPSGYKMSEHIWDSSILKWKSRAHTTTRCSMAQVKSHCLSCVKSDVGLASFFIFQCPETRCSCSGCLIPSGWEIQHFGVTETFVHFARLLVPCSIYVNLVDYKIWGEMRWQVYQKQSNASSMTQLISEHVKRGHFKHLN